MTLPIGADETDCILIVDWLGRGGIAHTSEAWIRELEAGGQQVRLLTRGGRELAEMVPQASVITSRLGPIASHVALVRKALALLNELRPRWLILQGCVLPQLELAVVRTANRLGIRTCCVAHEPEPPQRSPAASMALRSIWSRSDIVLSHTNFVADEVRKRVPRSNLAVIPFPKTEILVEQMASSSSVLVPDPRLTALTFGQLQKAYKGIDLIEQLATSSPYGWRFAVIGTGISGSLADLIVRHDGFLSAGELAATVAAAEVVLLPYRRASQSGAVVLAQEVGTPVISTAVGGIPEQVIDGENGILLPPDSSLQRWREALTSLEDISFRKRLADNARVHVAAQHAAFKTELQRLFLGRCEDL